MNFCRIELLSSFICRGKKEAAARPSGARGSFIFLHKHRKVLKGVKVPLLNQPLGELFGGLSVQKRIEV